MDGREGDDTKYIVFKGFSSGSYADANVGAGLRLVLNTAIGRLDHLLCAGFQATTEVFR